MPMHRKNSCNGAPRNSRRGKPGEAVWFSANVIRQRRRNKLAKLSRRKNRGK